MRAEYLSLGLLLAGVGCTSMQVVQPSRVFPSQKPSVVYVYTADGDAVAVRQPQVDGDTLRGIDRSGAQFAAALKDIAKLKAPERNGFKTGLLLGLGAVAGTVGIYELVNQTGNKQALACQGNLAVESECQPATY